MPNDLTTPAPHNILPPGADILTPLASRALFWRARYLADSPVLAHIPLLFWLAEAVRPRVAATLGLADAAAHFALCQAVDKLGMDSLCLGFEDSGADLAAQMDFNQANFADFSHLAQGSAGLEGFLSADSRIDLLIVNRPVTGDTAAALEQDWLPRLSERGVIVFLHGGHSLLLQAENVFTFDPDTGACVVFHGPDQNERLQRLASLKPGHPGYLATRNVFARLGELHTNAQALAAHSSEMAKALAERDRILAEFGEQRERLSDATRTANELKLQLQQDSGAQAEIQALQEENAQALEARGTAEAEIARLQDSMAAQKQELGTQQALLEKRLDDLGELGLEIESHQAEKDLLATELNELKDQFSTAGAERDKLKKLAAEQEESLGERYEDIAALGLEIQKRTAERDAAREEAEELKRRLGETEHLRDMHAGRVHALEGSTSWRVTAPLRKISLSLKRTPEEG